MNNYPIPGRSLASNTQTGVATVAQNQQGLEGQDVVPLQAALPHSKFEFVESEQPRGVVAWRLSIFDWRGGLNKQLDEVEEAHTRLADSTGVSHFKGYAHPPLLTTAQNTIAVTTPDTVFWTNFASRLVMATTGGAGALAASKLLAETSSANPVLIDTTYVPLGIGAIYGMWPLYIGNSASQRLAIGSSGNLDIISVLGSPPTSLGQVTAAGVTGLIQLPLPDQPFLAACGADLKYGTGSGAIGQTLTTVATPIAIGRQFLASASIGGRKARVFARSPIGISTAQTQFGATPGPWELLSTNPYGTDPQQHDVGLDDVQGIGFVRDGFIATNGQRVTFWNGRLDELGWKSDRKHSSTQDLVCRGLTIVDKREVIADVCQYGSGATTLWWRERYDWDLKAWSVISEQVELTDTPTTGTKNLLSARGSPSLPFAPASRYLHSCGGSGVTTARFARKYQEPPTVNPYDLRSKQSFAQNAVFLTPGLLFPAPITYAPKIVTGLFYGGDATGGGTTLPTPGAIRIEVDEFGASTGGVFGVWDSTVSHKGRYRPQPQNQTRILTPQVRATVTRGTDATLVPNGLPFVIEGLAYLPKRAKKPWLPW